MSPNERGTTSVHCHICNFCCRSIPGLKRHQRAKHPVHVAPPEHTHHTRIYHPHLNAKPCFENGTFIKSTTHHNPSSQNQCTGNEKEDETTASSCDNPWEPFYDRLEFDWANYHYVKLRSSASSINIGLDLWKAAVLKQQGKDKSKFHDDSVRWNTARDLYATIDSIGVGDLPWTNLSFSYAGPKPPTPPRWMDDTYHLNLRNILEVAEHQMKCPKFEKQFEYVPYQEYDHNGDRIYSNLFSGLWAYREADTIATDTSTHGAMFVPIVAGSDKTTVSVATGSQEYHPVYASVGNISNTARRGHGQAVMPVAFLPIPKASKRQRKKPLFQQFTRQLYHACLEVVFQPLKPYMLSPKVVKCPDGSYRKAIFSLGPYIADYPEQVWLACVVQSWCPKCDAPPDNLDKQNSHRRSHEKTDFLIRTFDPGILWDEYGIRVDVTPFTYTFPRANIHELLSPDLLHQLIKGTFKDHLVDWTLDYIFIAHPTSKAEEILEDIDHRISAVPSFAGLRRFPDGRDYKQWTGDDSKALMKVFLCAIAGYVPSAIVQCISAFMDACYIARRNAITYPALEHFSKCVSNFYELREIFINTGVCANFSLPRQHSLSHFLYGMQFFGAPNGLCSSITESSHIRDVKQHWRRSNRYRALSQMLKSITRMDKMNTLHGILSKKGMLQGSTLSYICLEMEDDSSMDIDTSVNEDINKWHSNNNYLEENEENENIEEEPASGNPALTDNTSLSDVKLATRIQPGYPRLLYKLANFAQEPGLPLALKEFIHSHDYPDRPLPLNRDLLPEFEGLIKVHHSAQATFYAPSDLCGAGGLKRERIRSTPSFYGHERRDTVFIMLDETLPGILGMEVARVRLFFSFEYRRKHFPCALVNWYPRNGDFDKDTGMWIVEQEKDENDQPTVQVVHIDTIVRAAHLIPVFGSQRIPDDFSFEDALDSFQSYFINRFVDHHAHELLTV